jgi:ABC-2 family transporter protein
MIWLAWRQFRVQAVAAAVGLTALTIVVLVTGFQLRNLYDDSGISTCKAVGDCDTVTDAFTGHFGVLQQLLNIAVFILPIVIGIFWGAPLVAGELATGTHRLAWTQSITRTRWLTAKLAIAGMASVVTSGLASLAVTWWFSPLQLVRANRFDPSVFNERAIAPIGYAVFAFALGVGVGLLVRRTLPAMAIALASYIATQIVVITWIRPHFKAPIKVSGAFPQPVPQTGGPGPGPIDAGFTKPGDWLISRRLVDASGHDIEVIRQSADDPCVATRSCFAGFHQLVTYQPANRYWSFQIYETALYCSLGVALIALSFWWIRKRMS